MLTQMTGVDILHVPYKGAAAAMLAVMSGEAQLSGAAASTAMAQIKSGKVKSWRLPARSVPRCCRTSRPPPSRACRVSKRHLWFALAAPARTPPAIVAKVNRDVTSILNTPDFRDVGSYRLRNLPEHAR